ncbi:MAG: GNAT family N-acetyltransferase [Bacteroidota bacterium]
MVYLQAVTSDLIYKYLETGLASYQQHYLHLWKNQDPNPYVTQNFTSEIVTQELTDPNIENFLVKVDDATIGIVKLIRNKALDDYDANSSLLIQKIYLLHEHSGKGYGHQLIGLLETHAKKLKKKVIWLGAMKKGNALRFYLKNGFTIHGESKLELPNAIDEERPMWILTKML